MSNFLKIGYDLIDFDKVLMVQSAESQRKFSHEKGFWIIFDKEHSIFVKCDEPDVAIETITGRIKDKSDAK